MANYNLGGYVNILDDHQRCLDDRKATKYSQ